MCTTTLVHYWFVGQKTERIKSRLEIIPYSHSSSVAHKTFSLFQVTAKVRICANTKLPHHTCRQAHRTTNTRGHNSIGTPHTTSSHHTRPAQSCLHPLSPGWTAPTRSTSSTRARLWLGSVRAASCPSRCPGYSPYR